MVTTIDYTKLTLPERLKAMINILQDGKKIGNKEEFCKEIGVSQTTLGFWLKGKHAPAAEQLIKISELYGVSTDWILTGKDSGNKAS